MIYDLKFTNLYMYWNFTLYFTNMYNFNVPITLKKICGLKDWPSSTFTHCMYPEGEIHFLPVCADEIPQGLQATLLLFDLAWCSTSTFRGLQAPVHHPLPWLGCAWCLTVTIIPCLRGRLCWRDELVSKTAVGGGEAGSGFCAFWKHASVFLWESVRVWGGS